MRYSYICVREIPVRLIRQFVAMCLVATTAAACIFSAPAQAQSAPPRDLLVSFSGGGFYSHTSLSGIVAGLMANDDNPAMADVFRRARMITSNSGGSWFMTHLAYSETFHNALALSPDGMAWGETGYIGEIQNHMPLIDEDEVDALCYWPSGDPMPDEICNFFEGYFSTYALMYVFFDWAELDWDFIVENGVFGPWNMKNELAGTTISPGTARNAWASEIDLLWACSMAGIEEYTTWWGDGGPRTYLSHNDYSEPNQNHHNNIYLALTHAPATPENLQWQNEPVTLSSVVSQSQQPGLFHVNRVFGYRLGDGWASTGVAETDPIWTSQLNTAGIGVKAAAMASSSAMGFMTSMGNYRAVKNSGLMEQLVSDMMQNMDVDFTIDSSNNVQIDLAPPFQTNRDVLVAERRFSTFDGAMTDDLGVCHMLKALAEREGTTLAQELAASPQLLIIESNQKDQQDIELDLDGNGYPDATFTVPEETSKLFDYELSRKSNGVWRASSHILTPLSGGLEGSFTYTGDSHGDGSGVPGTVTVDLFRWSCETAYNPVYKVDAGIPLEVYTLHVRAEEGSHVGGNIMTPLMMPSSNQSWGYLSNVIYHGCRQAMQDNQTIASTLGTLLGDECPDDLDKWNMGDCGCGVPESGDCVVNYPDSQFSSLQDAINFVPSGATLQIAEGIYYAHTLQAYGKPMTIRGTLNPDGSHATTIDAQSGGPVFYLKSNEGTDTIVKDLVITGGYIGSKGAGIHTYASRALKTA